MAVDYGKLTDDLVRFYDFREKVVLYVGAGGRHLLPTSIEAKRVVAIERDPDLARRIELPSRSGNAEVIAGNFEDSTRPGDVVYFEFCLHEMADPCAALTHAHTLAPDTVVFEHMHESEWVFHAAEEDQVKRAADALERFGCRRRQTFCTEQRFADYDALVTKIGPQGSLAIARAARWASATNIVIPMRYQLVLI